MGKLYIKWYDIKQVAICVQDLMKVVLILKIIYTAVKRLYPNRAITLTLRIQSTFHISFSHVASLILRVLRIPLKFEFQSFLAT